MLRAVVFTQYQHVTDGQTDGIAVASTALAKQCAVKTRLAPQSFSESFTGSYG